MKSSLLIVALLAGVANAQVFQDEPTCYSWSGGYKSSGSFTKCPASVTVVELKVPPAPPPVAVPQPVTPPPIIIRERCPQTPAPVVKPKKRKPAPKPTC